MGRLLDGRKAHQRQLQRILESQLSPSRPLKPNHLFSEPISVDPHFFPSIWIIDFDPHPMASQQDDPVFPDEDLDEDEDSIDEDEDDDDDELNGDVLVDEDVNSASPSTSFGAAVVVPDASVSVAVAGSVLGHSVPNGDPPVSTVSVVNVSGSNSQRQRFESTVTEPLIVQEEKKPIDEARRLFQRLWTDEDEIGLLQGFLDYTGNRGSTHHHHQHDTALFYDQIKSKLQLDFNKNQLVEKLRRLKKKYRNVMEKLNSGKDFNFKSPHDHATFEISRKIWSNIVRTGVDDNALDDDDPNPISINFEIREEEFTGNSGEKRTSTPSRSRKRSRSKAGLQAIDTRPSYETLNKDKNSCHNSNMSNMTGLIEGAVRSCLVPLFKELLNNAMAGTCGARGFGGLASNAMPLSFDGLVKNGGEITDDRWRKQQILELEVFSKRLELVQDQIKTTLEELRLMDRDAKRR